jgi:hypothetical protein
MLTLPDHFCTLLTRIEPEEKRTRIARDIPAQVRDFLQGHEEIMTIPPHSRLAGSYARHIALKAIKDVDIILLLDTLYRQREPEEVLNLVFRVVWDLSSALCDSGKPMVRRHQRRSVNIHLEDADFDLDIVPAVAQDGLDKPLLIPDKDWSKWVETHPLGYGQQLSELNSAHQEKVVPLIKLLKHWRDVHMSYRRPKSYWLECLVYHCIQSSAVLTDGRSYAELFHQVLADVHQDFLPYFQKEGAVPEIKDPMLGHNVAHNWERPAFETFMRRVEESLRWAEQALVLENEAKAVLYWQYVFGEEWFPQEVEQAKAQRLREAILAGSAVVTPTGRVIVGPYTGHAVQPSPQRFYGDPR